MAEAPGFTRLWYSRRGLTFAVKKTSVTLGKGRTLPAGEIQRPFPFTKVADGPLCMSNRGPVVTGKLSPGTGTPGRCGSLRHWGGADTPSSIDGWAPGWGWGLGPGTCGQRPGPQLPSVPHGWTAYERGGPGALQYVWGPESTPCTGGGQLISRQGQGDTGQSFPRAASSMFTRGNAGSPVTTFTFNVPPTVHLPQVRH